MATEKESGTNSVVFMADGQVISAQPDSDFIVLLEGTNIEITKVENNRIVLFDKTKSEVHVFNFGGESIGTAPVPQKGSVSISGGFLVIHQNETCLRVFNLDTFDETSLPTGAIFDGIHLLTIQKSGFGLVKTIIKVFDLVGSIKKEYTIDNIVGSAKTTKKYILIFRYDMMSTLRAVPFGSSQNEVELDFNKVVKKYKIVNDITFTVVFTEGEALGIIGPSTIILKEAKKIGAVK